MFLYLLKYKNMYFNMFLLKPPPTTVVNSTCLLADVSDDS